MNLIVTCARHQELDAQEELSKFLNEFGDSEPSITITEMSGILVADTKLDPIKTVREIKEKLLDEPWSVRYCLRIIPIQEESQSDIEKIEDAISKLSEKIQKDESYRILIEKRNSDISSQELITKVAKRFKNKVSLEYPDKIILIEILGNKAGVSILEKSDILSIEKTKRSISE